MPRQVKRLNAIKAAALKAKGLYPDGDGLYLQISPTGSKSWIFRFKAAGKARDMGLGPLSSVSLAKARKLAASAASNDWRVWIPSASARLSGLASGLQRHKRSPSTRRLRPT